MAGKHYITATLLLIFPNFTYATSIQYGKEHGNITLKANVKGGGKVMEILWKRSGNKVVELDQDGTRAYREFKGRVTVDQDTGDLTISNLTKRDNGNYKGEVLIGQQLQHSSHDVEIIEAVMTPEVNCTVNDGTVTLRCIGTQSPLTKYSWEGHNGQSVLLIKESRLDSVYTCIAKNPVSKKSVSFPAQECITAPDVSIGFIVGGVIGSFAVLTIMVFGIWFYCKKYKVVNELQPAITPEHQQNGEDNDNASENIPFIPSPQPEHTTPSAQNDESPVKLISPGVVKKRKQDFENWGLAERRQNDQSRGDLEEGRGEDREGDTLPETKSTKKGPGKEDVGLENRSVKDQENSLTDLPKHTSTTKPLVSPHPPPVSRAGNGQRSSSNEQRAPKAEEGAVPEGAAEERGAEEDPASTMLDPIKSTGVKEEESVREGATEFNGFSV
ncbi:hypothetical protein MATL_G00154980 [Megalops atlanticus]|uniref:Ig-like domain-containing protein n=1 Tax=Megalops atlanticus TaxID=7932 RepID=A0A9D3T2L7_MEGAT|nr:hypothetical protein MATL_G00154980 [Megalops atlanticus]